MNHMKNNYKLGLLLIVCDFKIVKKLNLMFLI